MSRTSIFKVQRKRRRSGRTNYKKRLGMLKSKKPRMVVRIKSKIIIIQIIEYKPEGDITLVATNSLELKKFGWDPKRNIPTAYLTGYLLGKKAFEKNIKGAILDIGLHTPVNCGRVFAALKGAVDAGMNIPHNEKAFPSKERLVGKHIEAYRNIKLDVESVKNKIK